MPPTMTNIESPPWVINHAGRTIQAQHSYWAKATGS